MTDYTVIAENIKLPIASDEADAQKAAQKIFKAAGIADAVRDVHLRRRSIDARRKDNIIYVCSVSAKVSLDRKSAEKISANGRLRLIADQNEPLVYGTRKLSARPVIVGFGPAGMFCALELAKNGYAPLVLERGGSVSDRSAAAERFMSGGEFSSVSNIQFGAGGAGTFSDGKLTTRIGDKYCDTVLAEFVRFGADRSILWQAKPHIGTDVLRQIVRNIDAEVRALGGDIRYECRVDSVGENRVASSDGDVPFGALVLAIGHSARDTYKSLECAEFPMIPKPFSVGVRIEHLRVDIDRAMYGDSAEASGLPPAEYALSHRVGDRGVYTFCMCPGGIVVPAASEDGGVVTNGMSYSARDKRNSNSAIAVSVLPEDFGSTVDGAIDFQRQLERAAYRAGGMDFSAPVQSVGSFLGNATPISRVMPTYMNGKVRETELADLFSENTVQMLRLGITEFAKKLRGFDAPDAVLTGVETRTSAPVRILRGDDRRMIGSADIYPCGEGAGYAGGIMSAAVDGIRTAHAIMREFALPDR